MCGMIIQKCAGSLASGSRYTSLLLQPRRGYRCNAADEAPVRSSALEPRLPFTTCLIQPIAQPAIPARTFGWLYVCSDAGCHNIRRLNASGSLLCLLPITYGAAADKLLFGCRTVAFSSRSLWSSASQPLIVTWNSVKRSKFSPIGVTVTPACDPPPLS